MGRSGVVALLLVLVPGVSGCSGTVSVEEFCEGERDYAEAVSALDRNSDDFIDDFRKATRDYADLGVPDEMPDDAVEGWEILNDAIEDLDDDEDPDLVTDDMTADEHDKVARYANYVAGAC